MRGPFLGLRGPSLGLRGSSLCLRGPSLGLEDPFEFWGPSLCLRALSRPQRTLIGLRGPFLSLSDPRSKGSGGYNHLGPSGARGPWGQNSNILWKKVYEFGPFKNSGRNPLTLFWSRVTLGHLKVDPQSKILGLPMWRTNSSLWIQWKFLFTYDVHSGKQGCLWPHSHSMPTGPIFLSGTLLSSGLYFRSNDHSLKHAYSLRPCSSSTARGPYMLGAREAPGGS